MSDLEFIRKSLQHDLGYWEKEKKQIQTMLFIEEQSQDWKH